jgi:glycerol uptake facilitator-like aquaporin
MKQFILELLATFLVCLTVLLCAHSQELHALPFGIAAVTGAFYLVKQDQHAYHLNPVLSLAAWAKGSINITHFFRYLLAQLVGSVLAGLIGVFLLIHAGELSLYTNNPQTSTAFTAEAMVAFFICFVGLQASQSHRVHPAVSLLYLASTFAFRKLGALVFNPALAIGFGLTGLVKWSDMWLFTIPALFGGLAAGTVLVGIFGRAHHELPNKMDL